MNVRHHEHLQNMRPKSIRNDSSKNGWPHVAKCLRNETNIEAKPHSDYQKWELKVGAIINRTFGPAKSVGPAKSAQDRGKDGHRKS